MEMAKREKIYVTGMSPISNFENRNSGAKNDRKSESVTPLMCTYKRKWKISIKSVELKYCEEKAIFAGMGISRNKYGNGFGGNRMNNLLRFGTINSRLTSANERNDCPKVGGFGIPDIRNFRFGYTMIPGSTNLTPDINDLLGIFSGDNLTEASPTRYLER